MSEAKICPCCQNSSVFSVDINIDRFYLCSKCYTTFLPSDQLLQIDRKIFAPAKKAWKEFLIAQSDPNTPSQCLLHSEGSLEQKKISGHAHQSFESTCCQLLHIRPSEWIKVLEVTENSGAEFNSTYKVKTGFNPLKFIFDLFKSKDSAPIDDLEVLQFKRKILPVLEGKIESEQ